MPHSDLSFRDFDFLKVVKNDIFERYSAGGLKRRKIESKEDQILLSWQGAGSVLFS